MISAQRVAPAYSMPRHILSWFRACARYSWLLPYITRGLHKGKLMKPNLAAFLFLSATLIVTRVSQSDASSAPAPAPNDMAVVLVGAGDIADCTDLSGAEATAKLLEHIPGTVMAIGDLAYPDGSKENFQC